MVHDAFVLRHEPRGAQSVESLGQFPGYGRNT